MGSGSRSGKVVGAVAGGSPEAPGKLRGGAGRCSLTRRRGTRWRCCLRASRTTPDLTQREEDTVHAGSLPPSQPPGCALTLV